MGFRLACSELRRDWGRARVALPLSRTCGRGAGDEGYLSTVTETVPLIAACAAARRAMGTRNGEQET